MTKKYFINQIAKWFTGGCRRTTTQNTQNICGSKAISSDIAAPSKLRSVLIGWTLLDSTQSLPRQRLLMCNLVRRSLFGAKWKRKNICYANYIHAG